MRTIVIAAAALAVATTGLAAVQAPADAGTTWRVSIHASTAQVLTGRKIVFSGIVSPKAAAVGEKVVLQEKFRPGKPWADQRKATIGQGGTYSVADRPTTNFVHSYRVVMPKTSKHAKGAVYGWDFLTTHAAVNGVAMSAGTVDINGKTFQNSLYAQGSKASVEYNLDHRCLKLRATFGVSDNSTTGGQAQVGVDSDGVNVSTETFDVGQSPQRKNREAAAPAPSRAARRSG